MMNRFKREVQFFEQCLVYCFLLANSTSATEPPITAVAFAPNGAATVCVSQSGLHVFSWPELDRQRTIDISASNLHCVVFSPNGKYLAVGGGYPSEQGVVQIFSWPDGKLVATFDDHKDSVRALAWKGSSRLLSASIDRQIRLWDIQNKTSTPLTYKGHSKGVNTVCLLKDGKTLVSAGVDQSVRVWNLESTRLIRSMHQHTRPVNAVALRPGESGVPVVASAAGDRTVRFWQPTIGRMLRFARLDAEPLNIAWLSDGTRIAASCVDGHIRVVDSGEVKVTLTVSAFKGWAYAIAVHPTEPSLLVGGSDGQLRRIMLPTIGS